ncbi:MAG TPA: hypothetical protein VFG52_07740, partial [Xanthomonadales bacterium]|nr:hypothetical protein [Xanthomonadales bacterium]
KQLVVLAPSSTFEFRGQGLDLRRVGAKLNATALLEGTVRAGAGMLRVNTRLVDINTGQQLWSGSFDRSNEDIFAVQDEIANAVTQALSLALSLEDESLLAQNPTNDLTAYDAYLLGRERLAQRRYEAMPEAESYFRLAAERDPKFALAYAGLAEALYLQVSYKYWQTNWMEIGPKARQAAATAISLDPDLGEGYLAQALVAMGDNEHGKAGSWPDSYISALLKKAVDLSPSNASALKFYAHYAEPGEKVEILVRAAQLDPRSAIIKFNLAENYEDQEKFDLAESWYLAAARSQDPPYLTGYKSLIELHLYSTQKLDQAARWAMAVTQAFPEEWRVKLSAARTLLELGAWDENRQLLDSMPVEKASLQDKPFLWVQLVEAPRLALARGDYESAYFLAGEFSRVFLETLKEWPDLSSYAGPWTSGLDIQALIDIQNGESGTALARYHRLLPDPASWPTGNFAGMTLRTPVIIAALQRLEGEPEAAEAALRQLLLDISGRSITRPEGIGFTRFTIHAFLGDTDAAIAALEEAVNAGWLPGWWGLKLGAFDSNYARVIADPRFQNIYAKLENRVRQLREDYYANPELPAEFKNQL